MSSDTASPAPRRGFSVRPEGILAGPSGVLAVERAAIDGGVGNEAIAAL